MMLDNLGEFGASERLMRAIETVTADGVALTPDLGGTGTTRQTTDAVLSALMR